LGNKEEIMSKKAKMIQTDDITDEQMDAAIQPQEATLPEPGHERREALKQREESLQEQIDRMSRQMLSGTLDAKALEVVNEIASKTQYLTVSSARPDYVYAWVSKNRHMQHIQALKPLGWEVVQGEDPEALELKGQDASTTRQLGDVILMRIKRDRYIVIKAQEQAKTRQIQRASASGLIELGNQHRSKGFIVKPYLMDGFEGPEIQPRVLSRKQAMKMVDKALRTGTVPGMQVQF
jgi:hypothetical protein